MKQRPFARIFALFSATASRTLVTLAVAVALVWPAEVSAAPAADIGPGFAQATKTKQRKRQTQEQSILDSIENQKMVLQLSERSAKDYALQVIALADFYWDLAEFYGFQALAEEIVGPLHEATERNDKAAIKKYTNMQTALNNKKAEFQAKTIEVYKEVIRDFPNTPQLDEIRYFLAYNLTEMGNPVEGVQVYTELIGAHRNSPFVPDAIVNIGEYYFEINDFSNAPDPVPASRQIQRCPYLQLRGLQTGMVALQPDGLQSVASEVHQCDRGIQCGGARG